MADAEIGSHERAERGAQNQALFRAINERISGRQWESATEPVEPVEPDVAAPQWICECANVGCFERISLSAVEYEHVRAVGWRFAVAPGELHVFPDIEQLAERTETYWIVEKSGMAREIAIALDGRDG